MHLSFESLAIIGALSLHTSLMDIHHDTSFKSILEENSISWTFKACIHSCSSKGARLWLVAKPFIHSFCIFSPQRYVFVSIWFSIWHIVFSHVSAHVRCIWHALSSLSVWRLTDSHTWCHLRCHVCPRYKWAHCMQIRMR
jgi:hypothetical protein